MSATTRRRSFGGAKVRASGDGSPRLSGHAAVFDSWTVLYKSKGWEVREVIRAGAFRDAIAAGQDVRALVDHNPTLILGRTKAGTLSLREDERGLAVEIDPPSSEFARGLIESVRRGDVDQMSFAFVPRPGGERTSTRYEGDLEITEVEVTSVDLYDVSLVTYPAYEATSIGLRDASAKVVERLRRRKEAWLIEARARSASAERRLRGL